MSIIVYKLVANISLNAQIGIDLIPTIKSLLKWGFLTIRKPLKCAMSIISKKPIHFKFLMRIEFSMEMRKESKLSIVSFL